MNGYEYFGMETEKKWSDKTNTRENKLKSE